MQNVEIKIALLTEKKSHLCISCILILHSETFCKTQENKYVLHFTKILQI